MRRNARLHVPARAARWHGATRLRYTALAGALSMRLLLVASLCCVAASCSFSEDGVSSGSPSAIRDAYLIAHGMAEGYRDQVHADPQVLAELARLDAEAAAAVHDMDGNGSPDQSARAVAALTDYAARQTTVAR